MNDTPSRKRLRGAETGLGIDALQQAVDGLREREDELKREREALRAERVALEKLKDTANDSLHARRVKLNVGGHRFDTTLRTLTRFPESMLGTMFSGREGVQAPTEDEDGCVFIDRDGRHFRCILEFLRTGVAAPGQLSAHEKQELDRELRFYLLHSAWNAARSEDVQEPQPQVIVTVGKERASPYGDLDHASPAEEHQAALAAALSKNGGLQVRAFTSEIVATYEDGSGTKVKLTTVLA